MDIIEVEYFAYLDDMTMLTDEEQLKDLFTALQKLYEITRDFVTQSEYGSILLPLGFTY